MNRLNTAANRHGSPSKTSAVLADGRSGLMPDMGANKITSTGIARAKCIGANEMADRNAFQYRVDEIMTMKNTGNVLNARVIETWINETLADAEHLDIPGVILKPTQKLPL